MTREKPILGRRRWGDTLLDKETYEPEHFSDIQVPFHRDMWYRILAIGLQSHDGDIQAAGQWAHDQIDEWVKRIEVSIEKLGEPGCL